MEYAELSESLDLFSRKLVGCLCKRVEVLGELCKESKILPENFSEIYKALAKELVHEHSRNLKADLLARMIPTVIYRPRGSK